MIAFNTNIVFPGDADKLDGNHGIQETIYVKEIRDDSIIPKGMKQTHAVLMSERSVIYHTPIKLDSEDRQFSWALEAKNLLTLVWNAKEKNIYYRAGEEFTEEKLYFWVLHTFLPLVFELEGKYRILHVGSVEIDGDPVLFSAFSFGGKSTLVDFFLKKGHKLLSDDSLGIEKRDDGYYAVASYPFHRPFREPETLGYYTEYFEKEVKPVHVLYLLTKSAPECNIEINELKGVEKFKAFHYSSFVEFDFMKKERFEYFTQMAKQVSVYQVHLPWDLERVNEVYEAIVIHSRSLH